MGSYWDGMMFRVDGIENGVVRRSKVWFSFTTKKLTLLILTIALYMSGAGVQNKTTCTSHMRIKLHA
jgi:hypothetical protein